MKDLYHWKVMLHAGRTVKLLFWLPYHEAHWLGDTFARWADVPFDERKPPV